MWPPFLLSSLCTNRTLKSGPRWWSITSPAAVNSPVTAPFPSMPGRSGAWSPVWRRSLPLMILAKPHLPPPPHCSSPCGPTTAEKPCSFFTLYCGIISLHYWSLYNLLLPVHLAVTCIELGLFTICIFSLCTSNAFSHCWVKPCISTSAFQQLRNSLDFTLESWDSLFEVKTLEIHFLFFFFFQNVLISDLLKF